ncbi:rhodopsin [Halobacteriales archaeon QH_8_64_26]|nr:MAG: rhodopsin [Halobacteriales archaeon QH_8_64_26]
MFETIPLQSGGGRIALEVGAVTNWTLWITTILMGLGAAGIIYQGRSLTSEEGIEHTVISALIPAIAMSMYLGMATGIGIVSIDIVGQGTQEVFWMRYTDWVVTTPLLLLDLALLAKADRNTIGLLLGLDVYMIVAGLIGAFETVPVYRYLWWVISTGAFLAIVWLLLGPLSEQASQQDGNRASSFETLRNLLLGVWVIYPIVWLLGVEGFGLIPVGIETIVYAVLDLTAKVVFGFLMVNAVSDVTGSERTTQTDAAATADD